MQLTETLARGRRESPPWGRRIAAMTLLVAGFGGGGVLAAQPDARLPSPWISCSDVEHVAYRAVPPALNPHNAFTHPIKVRLKPGETCADLK